MKPQLQKNPKLGKLVNKFKTYGFTIDDGRIRGEVNIQKIRTYSDNKYIIPIKTYEVDFKFEGEIFASNPLTSKTEWLKSDILNSSMVSKIKVNKFIRRRLEDKVFDIMELFGVDEVIYYGQIKLKKVTWI